MAKKLPRSLTKKAAAVIDDDDPVLAEARARYSSQSTDQGGGAWARAGASVMSAELEKLQAERIDRLLNGNLVVELSPEQIIDSIGSDRAAGWEDDEAFAALKDSIRENGQDVPIQLKSEDPNWRPSFSEADGLVLEGVRFRVISGRRRLEAARQLGLRVRAVCLPQNDEVTLDELHRRFRENVERENLTLVEELLAIGEMFSHEKTLSRKVTGRTLAKALGVAEAKVSRARAVFEHKDRLFAEIANPKALTLHQLDKIIPALRAGEPLPALSNPDNEDGTSKAPAEGRAPQSRPAALKRTQIIKGRKIVARARHGKITLDLGNKAQIDEKFLDKLLLFIQTNATSELS